jgi:hypothetical protein
MYNQLCRTNRDGEIGQHQQKISMAFIYVGKDSVHVTPLPTQTPE